MELHAIEAGYFYCDGGAMFGVVPKKVWQKRYPCDENNYCCMAMRCLLVKTEDRLILIDTGTGEKQLKYLKYYNLEKIIRWDEALGGLGYACEQVTDVVLTHLHFDHCGGCTYYDGQGVLQMRFPNATHWVGKAQWDNFLCPNVREGNSYFAENMQLVADAGLLSLIECDTWLCSDMQLRVCGGHTVGQLLPFMPNAYGGLFYTGDVFPVAPSLPPAWVSAYDTHPLEAMRVKEQLLNEAASHGYSFFFGHDAYTQQGRIIQVNGHFRLE